MRGAAGLPLGHTLCCNFRNFQRTFHGMDDCKNKREEKKILGVPKSEYMHASRPCHTHRCACYVTFLVAFKDEDLTLPLGRLMQSVRGRITVGAEVAALALMTPFLALEVGCVDISGVQVQMRVRVRVRV
jgi:hypothetical protein